jgi:hypothetical protein
MEGPGVMLGPFSCASAGSGRTPLHSQPPDRKTRSDFGETAARRSFFCTVPQTLFASEPRKSARHPEKAKAPAGANRQGPAFRM